MSESVIAAEELSFRHGTGAGGATNALDAVSFTIDRGRRVALLGANGAGKTTLLLHLNGILRPNSGRICFGGKQLDYSTRDLAALRERIGLVLQDPDDQLLAATVIEDIAYGLLNLGRPPAEAMRRAEEILERMGLGAMRDRPPHLLSGGERKRVALAGVLVMKPEVFLLDEPFAGLDANGVERLMAELDENLGRESTVIFSTHETDLAYAWADDAILLSKGRIVGQGTVATVLGDAALLAVARMPMPWIIEAGRALGIEDLAGVRTRKDFMERCRVLGVRHTL
jgi:cobalt/nickel transport system ATP-binding protein